MAGEAQLASLTEETGLALPRLPGNADPLTIDEAVQRIRGNLAADVMCADNDILEHGARKLANAMHQNNAVTAFQLTCAELPHNGVGDEGIREVTASLENNQLLHTLMVDHCNLSAIGAGHVAKLLRANTTLTAFDISSNNVEEAGCKLLCDALQNNAHLKALALGGNEVGALGGRHIATLLQRNTMVERLELSDNDLRDDGMKEIAKALLKNQTLTKLDLSSNNIGEDGARDLARILVYNTSLTDLNVSRNHFTGDSDAVFCDAFVHNKGVRSLDMRWTRLDDDGAEAFADMLERNSTLTRVDLRGNFISLDGLSRLARTMKTNKTITSLQVFDAHEKNYHQIVLNKFTRRNGVNKKERPPPSVITAVDCARRLGWGHQMVMEWVEKGGIRNVEGPFKEMQMDGKGLMLLDMGALRSMGIAPHAARLEVLDHRDRLRTKLDRLIREERGEINEAEDEEERLLRTYEPPENLSHHQKMRQMCDRSLDNSPLKVLRAKLEKHTTADDDYEREAAATALADALGQPADGTAPLPTGHTATSAADAHVSVVIQSTRAIRDF